MTARGLFAATVLTWATLSAGCVNTIQSDIAPQATPVIDSSNGIVIGSVTAPFEEHYHETVVFDFRARGTAAGSSRVLTSGMQHKNFLMGIPSCTEGGLAGQCGRLFAVSLPAGDYELFKGQVWGRGFFEPFSPAGFTVAAGQVTYIGNVHVKFCKGMPTRYHGNILGADVSIRDEHERDVPLIRRQFATLPAVTIGKRLLPDRSWRWRASFDSPLWGAGEPHDWGGCSSPAPGA